MCRRDSAVIFYFREEMLSSVQARRGADTTVDLGIYILVILVLLAAPALKPLLFKDSVL